VVSFTGVEPPSDPAHGDPILDQNAASAPIEPPRPREVVARAHRVPRTHPDRSSYLRLDLGECRAPASPHVAEAIAKITPDDLAAYPDPEPLADQLADFHGVDRARITVTAGADEAIRWAFNAFVEEGARVILPRPTFGAFLSAAEAGGAFVSRVDYPEDLQFPTEAIRDLLSPRTPRLVVLANPNAPTGSHAAIADIHALAGESPSTLFLVNESYVSFHGESLIEEDRARDLPANVAVIRSFSKDFGLAGLRVGWIVGHPDVIGAIDHVRPSFTVSVAALRAASAALSDIAAMRTCVTRVCAVMDRLVEKLEERRIPARTTRANFVLVKLTAPIQPWAAALAARGILVGTRGHVGPLADVIRVSPTTDAEVDLFVDAIDLLVAQGITGASEVRGVRGRWDDLSSEGMG
jgi:histidinol-phosphate aminotransferase